ncbi:golgin subfamily A member 6B-like [Callithrix jacchus]
MDIAKENADLKKQVEKLELRFIPLSGERDMIRKSIKPNDRQRAVAKTQHQKNDVSVLSQAEEGMKVKLLEPQGPVMQLMINHEVQHPANESTPGAPAPQELGAADKDELCEVILADSLQPAGGRVHHNSTAQQMAHGFVSCRTASNTDPWAAVPPRHAFTGLWAKERVNITVG